MKKGSIKELIKKYENKVGYFCINFVILLLVWGGMLRKSFNADTIFHMVVDDADIGSNIRAGRYVIGLIDLLLFKMGIRTTTNLSVTMLLTIVIFAIALCKLQEIFKKWLPEENIQKVGFLCGVSLVFFNVLFSELLMFREYCIYYAIGYLAAIVGAKWFLKRKYLRMFLTLMIAVSCYQYTVVFTAILLAFLICLEEEQKFSGEKVLREAAAVGSCMGIGVLNLLSMIVFEKLGIFSALEKEAGLGDLGDKLEDAWESFVGLNRNSAGILPDLWLPLLFSLGVWGIIVFCCIRKKKTDFLLLIAVVWLGSHFILYIIPLVNKDFYFPPRMSFCFYLIQGLMVVIAYMVSRAELQKTLTLACFAYLMIQLLFVNFTVTNHFISNTLDEVYTNMVYQEILKYEEKTGIHIEKLAVTNDAYAPNSYNNVSYTSGQINERAIGQVNNSLMWVISGRYFEKEKMDEDVYQYYFEGKDWDYFDLSQQLVIVGDTAYWCIF